MELRRLIVLGLAGAAMALGAGGCRPPAETAASDTEPAARPRPVRVVASTPIVAELVRKVGGGGVVVESLLAVEEPPASLRRTGPFESRLIAADLIVLLGFGQEAVLAPSLTRATEAGAVVCELAAAFPPDRVLPDPRQPDQPDTQIWLDPLLWLEAVKPIEEALAGLRPEWAGEWRSRANAARFDLEETGRGMQRLARIAVPAEAGPTRTRQPGLRYVARAAGVPVEWTIDEAAAPRPDDLEKLALDHLRPPGVKAIAGVREHDLSTVDGLRAYALDLMLQRWR